MVYQIDLFEKEAQPALVIHTRADVKDLATILGASYAEIGQLLAKLGEEPAGHPFVGYFNMDMQDLDLQIGIPVASTVPGTERIESVKILGGQCASTWHVGPYSESPAAYDALNHWLMEHGYQPAGPVYEFYANSPLDTAPEDLRTQIVFPVTRA